MGIYETLCVFKQESRLKGNYNKEIFRIQEVSRKFLLTLHILARCFRSRRFRIRATWLKIWTLEKGNGLNRGILRWRCANNSAMWELEIVILKIWLNAIFWMLSYMMTNNLWGNPKSNIFLWYTCWKLARFLMKILV